jgi:transcriptional regulator with XRE-family HTH domain
MANKMVGENIRRFREARGLLQRDLGERVGKCAGTVSNWELGLRDPGADNIKLLAAALEISPSELIGHNDDVRQDSTFEVVCMDDSMLPEIKPGDRLLVRKYTKPKDGDIVVADLHRYKRQTAPVVRVLVICDDMSLLIPINRKKIYKAETDFTLLGKVEKITRKL